jgi:hypothetical protein
VHHRLAPEGLPRRRFSQPPLREEAPHGLNEPEAAQALAGAGAAPQLEVLRIAPGAGLVALVKPVYELGLAALPTED